MCLRNIVYPTSSDLEFEHDAVFAKTGQFRHMVCNYRLWRLGCHQPHTQGPLPLPRIRPDEADGYTICQTCLNGNFNSKKLLQHYSELLFNNSLQSQFMTNFLPTTEFGAVGIN